MVEAHGDDHLEAISIHCTVTNEINKVPANSLFIMIGAAPNTDWLANIKAYGSELNQGWTNLIVSAVDAMSESGTLKVRTKREPTDILVEIRDNGAGIPAAVRSRIFEPFFTTRINADLNSRLSAFICGPNGPRFSR